MLLDATGALHMIAFPPTQQDPELPARDIHNSESDNFGGDPVAVSARSSRRRRTHCLAAKGLGFLIGVALAAEHRCCEDGGRGV